MAENEAETVFAPHGQMTPERREKAEEKVKALADAYLAARDALAYATALRDEAADQLKSALRKMRLRVLHTGDYRVALKYYTRTNLDKSLLLSKVGQKVLEQCTREERAVAIDVTENRSRAALLAASHAGLEVPSDDSGK
jgi:collagenase-like PrtC family protease